jgi:hypothetical protein
VKLKVVIPSRRRADTIRAESLAMLPDAFVIVDEREYDDYAKVVDKERLLTHPSLTSFGPIANRLIDETPKDETLVLFGDDHVGAVAIPGWSPRRLKPRDIPAVLMNAAICASDARCGLFGFGRNPNPLMYEPTRPWRLAQWPTSPLGFVPGHGLHFDERLKLMLDVDLALQSLLKHRIVWFDSRFCFVGKALNNKGGNAHLRSDEAFAAERELLKQKWGKFIKFDTTAVHSSERYAKGLPATTLMTYLLVPRVQGSF